MAFVSHNFVAWLPQLETLVFSKTKVVTKLNIMFLSSNYLFIDCTGWQALFLACCLGVEASTPACPECLDGASICACPQPGAR